MPTAAETALQLHLAGVGADQIARTTGLSLTDVDDAIAVQLEDRHPGLTLQTAAEIEQLQTLWRRAYADGVAGDQAAIKLALDLQREIRELRSQPGTVTEPASAADGIRESWGDLAAGAPEAAAALRQLVRSGKSESVRQRAAATLLSRVGVTERVEVAASVRMQTALMDPEDPNAVGKTAEEIVKDRLLVLAERHARMTAIDALPEPATPDQPLP